VSTVFSLTLCIETCWTGWKSYNIFSANRYVDLIFLYSWHQTGSHEYTAISYYLKVHGTVENLSNSKYTYIGIEIGSLRTYQGYDRRCLTPLSTIFQLCRGRVLLVEETTDMSQVPNKLYHIIIMLYREHLAWAGFEPTTSVVIIHLPYNHDHDAHYMGVCSFILRHSIPKMCEKSERKMS
jgi:hypothetical protein